MTKKQLAATKRNMAKGKIASMIGLIEHLFKEEVLTRTETAWLNDAKQSLRNIYLNWNYTTKTAKKRS